MCYVLVTFYVFHFQMKQKNIIKSNIWGRKFLLWGDSGICQRHLLENEVKWHTSNKEIAVTSIFKVSKCIFYCVWTRGNSAFESLVSVCKRPTKAVATCFRFNDRLTNYKQNVTFCLYKAETLALNSSVSLCCLQIFYEFSWCCFQL